MPTRITPTADGFFRRKIKGPWWTRLNGQPVTTGCTDVTAARLWRAEREREAASPAYGASKRRTLLEGVERFLVDVEAAGRAEGTLENYAQCLAPWRAIWGDALPLADITATLVSDAIRVQLADKTKRAGPPAGPRLMRQPASPCAA